MTNPALEAQLRTLREMPIPANMNSAKQFRDFVVAQMDPDTQTRNPNQQFAQTVQLMSGVLLELIAAVSAMDAELRRRNE